MKSSKLTERHHLCHFWNITIYIPFAEVLLAFRSVGIVHLLFVLDDNSGVTAKAIAIFCLNGSAQDFWCICMCIYGVKTQNGIYLPGLIILISCFFYYYDDGKGDKKQKGTFVPRVLSRKDRLLKKMSILYLLWHWCWTLGCCQLDYL